MAGLDRAAKPGTARGRTACMLAPRHRGTGLIAAALTLLTLAGRAQAVPSCNDDPNFHVLDFWLGAWNVFVGDTLAGTNRITRILNGCAVSEDWRDADGTRGMSLFYYQPATRLWKQVWVTEQALEPGGIKEKHLVARLPGGGTRFQGEIALPDGRLMLDRTTLTPEANGEVRQVIEVSRDGGTTWRIAFDARYRRAR